MRAAIDQLNKKPAVKLSVGMKLLTIDVESVFSNEIKSVSLALWDGDG
jgi:hypothetical protein